MLFNLVLLNHLAYLLVNFIKSLITVLNGYSDYVILLKGQLWDRVILKQCTNALGKDSRWVFNDITKLPESSDKKYYLFS